MTKHIQEVTFATIPTNAGGPSSFQLRVRHYLEQHGIKTSNFHDAEKPDCVMVVASTGNVFRLLLEKIRGRKIIHRLDGLNYFSQSRLGSFKVYLRSRVINRLMWFIRKYLADHVVYQSDFVRDWWIRKYGKVSTSHSIIYNGAAIAEQAGDKGSAICESHELSLICVEGNIQDDAATVNMLLDTIRGLISESKLSRFYLLGGIGPRLAGAIQEFPMVKVLGRVSREEVAAYQCAGAIHLCLEFNPPCPNSVIESLASGVPVVGLDTGSLHELVGDDAGVLVKYDGDPFVVNKPVNTAELVEAIKTVALNYSKYSSSARKRAIDHFSIEKMGESYLDVILSTMSK